MRIKICGLTTEDDALLAAELGADALGLNFYAWSPRYISQDKARAILRAIPPFVEPIALFVNPPPGQIRASVTPLARIHTVQVHGVPPDPAELRPFTCIPAFQVAAADDLQAIDQYLEQCQERDALPAALLIDSRVPGEFGGTGVTAPWELLANYEPELPLILAGGLTPENVAEAIRIVRPYAVDVATGVESEPGRKDPEKIRRFVVAAREAAAKL